MNKITPIKLMGEEEKRVAKLHAQDDEWIAEQLNTLIQIAAKHNQGETSEGSDTTEVKSELPKAD